MQTVTILIIGAIVCTFSIIFIALVSLYFFVYSKDTSIIVNTDNSNKNNNSSSNNSNTSNNSSGGSSSSNSSSNASNTSTGSGSTTGTTTGSTTGSTGGSTTTKPTTVLSCQSISDSFDVYLGHTDGLNSDQNIKDYWNNNACNTLPKNKYDCQTISNIFGSYPDDMVNANDPNVIAYYKSQPCKTAPSPITSCSYVSENYNTDPKNSGTATAQAKSYYNANSCQTAPKSKLVKCQYISDVYGAYPDNKPKETNALINWNANNCKTAPDPVVSCQAVSNLYNTTKDSWGTATPEAKSFWNANACDTVPTSSLTCQYISNTYGVMPTKDISNLPQAIQDFWKTGNNRKMCNTAPLDKITCQDISDIWGAYPPNNFPNATEQSVKDVWTNKTCTTAPQPITNCQYVSDTFGTDLKTPGTATIQAQNYYLANKCQSAPKSKLSSCQYISDTYGSYPKNNKSDDPIVSQYWNTSDQGGLCKTAPKPADSCQSISDTYNTQPNADGTTNYGTATIEAKNYWDANKCNTLPSKLWDCQLISNIYGTTPNDAGKAPDSLRSWYIKTKCDSIPSSLKLDCQTISNTWGVYPPANYANLTNQSVKDLWNTGNNGKICTTAPAPITSCQYVSDTFKIDPITTVNISNTLTDQAVQYYNTNKCNSAPKSNLTDCSYISNTYGSYPSNSNTTDQVVDQAWKTGNQGKECKTVKGVTNCQDASDQYGIISGVPLKQADIFGKADSLPNIKAFWTANQCTTIPTIAGVATCQDVSNKYNIVAGKSYGTADTVAKAFWSLNKCDTIPTIPGVSTCQDVSDKYGIVAGETFGSADLAAQAFWDRNKCDTIPRSKMTCQYLSNKYGTYSGNWANLKDPQIRPMWDTLNNGKSCTTAPGFTTCQEASDRFGMISGNETAWAKMGAVGQAFWSNNNCDRTTIPTNQYSCQKFSDFFGTYPGNWANLTDPLLRPYWDKLNNGKTCTTAPGLTLSCKELSNKYGIIANQPFPSSTNDMIQKYWSANNCNTIPDVMGRYVTIIRDGSNGIAIRQIEIFQSLAKDAPNIALGKTVTSSSVYPVAAAKVSDITTVTNGNLSNVFITGDNDKLTYIQVDLGADVPIIAIEIFNRLDGLTQRINGCYVRILKSDGSEAYKSDQFSDIQNNTTWMNTDDGSYPKIASYQILPPNKKLFKVALGSLGSDPSLAQAITNKLIVSSIKDLAFPNDTTVSRLIDGNMAKDSPFYNQGTANKSRFVLYFDQPVDIYYLAYWYGNDNAHTPSRVDIYSGDASSYLTPESTTANDTFSGSTLKKGPYENVGGGAYSAVVFLPLANPYKSVKAISLQIFCSTSYQNWPYEIDVFGYIS